MLNITVIESETYVGKPTSDIECTHLIKWKTSLSEIKKVHSQQTEIPINIHFKNTFYILFAYVTHVQNYWLIAFILLPLFLFYLLFESFHITFCVVRI